jgi:hypothetical protein
MGRQLDSIIAGLAAVTGSTGTINVNLDAIEALLTTLQADVADGIIVTNTTRSITAGTVNASVTGGTITTGTVNASLTGGTITTGTVNASVTGGTITTGTVTAAPIRSTTTSGTLTANTTNGTLFGSNASRNYLLVQCTSGTAFIDTNGTATTAAGILLTSGQGITFEGGFIPTGAIAAITSTSTAQLIGRQG